MSRAGPGAAGKGTRHGADGAEHAETRPAGTRQRAGGLWRRRGKAGDGTEGRRDTNPSLMPPSALLAQRQHQGRACRRSGGGCAGSRGCGRRLPPSPRAPSSQTWSPWLQQRGVRAEQHRGLESRTWLRVRGRPAAVASAVLKGATAGRAVPPFKITPRAVRSAAQRSTAQRSTAQLSTAQGGSLVAGRGGSRAGG